jgi:hypothetical protein
MKTSVSCCPGISRFYVVCILLLNMVMPWKDACAARTFVHPGASLSNDDIANMKKHIAAKENPWYSEWLILQASSLGSSNYTATPSAEIGGSDGTRQRVSADATAALYNAIEWRVTGDVKYADCAARILSAHGNTMVTASAQLYQFPSLDLTLAAEMLRDESGAFYSGWALADRTTFLSKVRTILVPACRSEALYNTMTSWSAPAAACVLAAGVLLEDSAIYEEGLSYYRSKSTSGSVYNALLPNGQVKEMGRDNVHAMLTLGDLAFMAQTAWYQGDDLFSEDNNRILKGFDYWCRYNSGHPETPYVPQGKWYYISTHDNGFRLRPDGTNFEILYHHFKEVKGLDESQYPFLSLYTKLGRPERDYRTLFYTRDLTTSPVFKTVPGKPTGFRADAGMKYVQLSWDHPVAEDVRGFKVYRSTTGLAWALINTWDYYTNNTYRDESVVAGVKYYYKISFINYAGESVASDIVTVVPDAGSTVFADGWAYKSIGTTNTGSATYSKEQVGSVVLDAIGADMGSTSDSHGFAYTKVTGNTTLTARLNVIDGTIYKVGLVMRETLDANSRRVAITLGEVGWRYCRMATRTSAGANTTWLDGDDFTYSPMWMRISRIGNNFTVSQSRDSITWFDLGTSSVAMGQTIFAGFYANSGSNSGTVAHAEFDHIGLTGGGTKPAAPTVLSGTALSSTKIQLTWNASTLASTYNLQVALNANGPFTTVQTGLTTLTCLVSDLVQDTDYYFVLKSANGVGVSSDSIRYTIRTLSQLAPTAPTGIKSVSGNNKVTLTWTAPNEVPLNYQVKRSSTRSGVYVILGKPTTTTYTDNTALNDSAYYYTVSAVNAKGEGPNSDTVSALPVLVKLRYWSFNESGTTRQAVCAWTNAVASLQTTGATWLGTSKYNGGLLLDKTTSAFAILNGNIFSNLNDMTISIWIKPTTVEAGAKIYDFGSSTTNHLYLTPKSTDGYLRFGIQNTGGTEQTVATSITISANLWTFLTVTITDGYGYVYVNGFQASKTALTLKPSSLGTTTLNYLGKSQLSTDPYYNGAVDEFRIYGGALSSAEVLKLYQAKTQTIAFDSIPAKSLTSPDFSPNASASSGLSVDYLSSNTAVASVTTNKMLRIIGTGTANILANQSGSLSFVAALPVSRPLTVTTGTSLSTNDKQEDWMLSPNPARDRMQIRFQGETPSIRKMDVFNRLGQKMPVEFDIDHPGELDIRQLPAGMYLLRLILDDKTETRNFIKRN